MTDPKQPPREQPAMPEGGFPPRVWITIAGATTYTEKPLVEDPLFPVTEYVPLSALLAAQAQAKKDVEEARAKAFEEAAEAIGITVKQSNAAAKGTPS